MITLLIALGCTPSDGDPTDTGTPLPDLSPAVEIGTGETEFVPLAEGDEVVVVFGPQGGYHLDGSLRAQGIVPGDADDLSSPDNPTTIFRVFDAAGLPVAGTEGSTEVDYVQGIDATAEPGVFEMVGRRIFLDIPNDDVLVGDLIDVEVEVRDVEGTVVTDRRTVLAVAHPFNP